MTQFHHVFPLALVNCALEREELMTLFRAFPVCACAELHVRWAPEERGVMR